jgi:Intracellular proteinase inhibitor
MNCDLQPASARLNLCAMKFPIALCCVAALSIAHAFAADAVPEPEKKPGIFKRMLRPFGVGKRAAEATPAPVPASAPEKKRSIMNRVLHPFSGGKGGAEKNKAGLAAALTLSPLPLKLADTNRLKVTLTLTNRGKKLAPLEFATSQRIDVLIKNSAGKTIEQWSQDQSFTNEPTVVTINPGERAEYAVEIATREMSAGQTYTVEGFFPGYSTLRASQTLVPEK